MAIGITCNRCGAFIKTHAHNVEDAIGIAELQAWTAASDWAEPAMFCPLCAEIIGNDEATEEFFRGPRKDAGDDEV